MKKNKLPNIVVILILTLITAVMWISLNIYRSLTTKPAPVVPENISNPLTPTLDTQTLNQIGTRTYFDVSQIPEITITQGSPQPIAKPKVTPIAVPSPNPLATSSGTPTATPAATP